MDADPIIESPKAFAGLLSPAEITEFQRLVQDSCGGWLDEDEAAARASQLLYLVVALIGIPPEPGGSNVVRT